MIESQFSEAWLNEKGFNQKQKDLCLKALNLGAYSLPKMVIESETVDKHVRDMLRKELLKKFEELRKG